jgi:hypothetical protein
MKKILLLLLVTSLFWSCSNDDETQQDDFFNLNTGNVWVYKRYHNNNNTNYIFSNRIDSVKVVGDTLISGLTYSKLVHNVYYTSGNFSSDVECLRVNDEGHLVDQYGLVIHPGDDMQYQSTRQQYAGMELIGLMNLQLFPPFEENVEGVDYFVFSYHGDFVSNNPSIPNNFIYTRYQKGIGMVSQHCPAVSGVGVYQDRLVYYEVN